LPLENAAAFFVPEERRAPHFLLNAEKRLAATSIDVFVNEKRNQVKKG
jgi:hypothetical protein